VCPNGSTGVWALYATGLHCAAKAGFLQTMAVSRAAVRNLLAHGARNRDG
jgi:hypothetical protein